MSKQSLGDLQHAIMRILWSAGEATSAQVHAALLVERGLAPTTIATMLRKMEQKGVVTHRAVGRQFIGFEIKAGKNFLHGRGRCILKCQ